MHSARSPPPRARRGGAPTRSIPQVRRHLRRCLEGARPARAPGAGGTCAALLSGDSMHPSTHTYRVRRPGGPGPHGFTLVELAVTIMVMGLLLAIAVPSIRSMSQSYKLKGATENMAARLRLYRDRAITTGRIQHFHFVTQLGWDYMVFPMPSHSPDSLQGAWRLPNGITYGAGTLGWVEMLPNGRANFSGVVVLRDQRGNQDTVSVQTSGLVLTQ